jgi:Zn-dependent protease/CBS domain-containing protein
MRWSLSLGRIAGIRVYVHFTFFILVGWIAFLRFLETGRWEQALFGVALFGCLAAIIVLHELGHALAARRYGIRTRDITLLPIGGIARLERIPEKPGQELVVALAGPAVNVVLAAGLFIGLSLSGALANLEELLLFKGSLPNQLLLINISLALFNMIPAFPMDGGRALRAILAMAMDYVDATRVAATIGQVIAVLFALVGLFLFQNFVLVIIALFVWMGAEAEASMVRTKSVLAGVTVARVMVTRFQVLAPTDTLRDVVALVAHGFQHDFPVARDGQLVGMLTRNRLLEAIAQKPSTTAMNEIMQTKFETAQPRDTIETAFERLEQSECPVLPVTENGRLVGLLTPGQVGEYLMLQESIREGRLHRRAASHELVHRNGEPQSKPQAPARDEPSVCN